MIDLLKSALENNLSPNQLYYLFCIKEGKTPEIINVHIEGRALVADEWLINGKLSAKAVKLLNGLQPSKNKPAVTISQENITKYLEMFPKTKLPSGKFARSPVSVLEANFKWFFQTFDYDWDLVLKATASYVDEYENKTPRYLYMQTSAYFISKMRQDKVRESNLAEYCENIKTGGDEENQDTFKERVV